METFVVDLKKIDEDNKWGEFQVLMDHIHDETEKAIQILSEELDISIDCARDIIYLRTRSRHSSELEKELIRLHDIGTPPNIYEFGCKDL